MIQELANTDVVLQIGSQRFTGWKRISITRGIEQLAGEFDLTCADRWAINGQAQPVLPGLECSVTIRGVPVITGFIDEATQSYDPNDHSLQIRGRDRTGDLVDCAAQTDGQAWEGRTLLQIARDICKPFGVTVTATGAPGNPFMAQAVHPGETAFELLSRAARLRGVLCVSDSLGGLTITRAGTGRAERALKLGEGIIAGSRTSSHIERFRTYRVVGQDGAGEQFDSEAAQQILAVAVDGDIRASRLTVLDPADAADVGAARQLAGWTKANRKARGERAEYTVRGWMDGAKPWQPNTLVRVDDDWLGIHDAWLIATVTYALDDQGGEISQLSLTPADSYVPAPLAQQGPK